MIFGHKTKSIRLSMYMGSIKIIILYHLFRCLIYLSKVPLKVEKKRTLHLLGIQQLVRDVLTYLSIVCTKIVN